MIEVRIPSALRADVDGASVVRIDVAGPCTLHDVLHQLFAIYPPLRARVMDDQGSVRRFVNVYVNDDEQGRALSTLVPDDAVIYILPSIAGGAAERARDDVSAAESEKVLPA